MAKHSERTTDEAFNIDSMWYEGEVAHTEDQDATSTSNGNTINISTLGLRKSQQIKDLKKAELEIPTRSNETGFPLQIVNICIQTAMISYQEYLDTNFDGTQNNLSIIGQIFAAEVSNENYTLKEMMQQTDRKEFEAAMYKEVKHMIDNKVWKK
eukprot:13137006-Ditylum_brightwellii.AAC.1